MTLRELLRITREKLAPVSGEDANIDARELVSYALGRRIGFADMQLSPTAEQLEKLRAATERRLQRVPLQYVVGEWDFMGLTFAVTEDVLIPRQDTETLCIEAERLIRERGYERLLDICTGSGCIGAALALRTGIGTTLSDISPAALRLAERNAAALGAKVRIAESDLFAAFAGERFDIITANPPYIPTPALASLSPEVRKEPVLALDGGEDGLDIYRRIRAQFAEHLNPGGALVMEIGYDQGKSVPALFEGAGRLAVLKDDCGNDRVVTVAV